MKELNKRYRCIPFYDNDGKFLKSDINSKGENCFDADNCFIYCGKASRSGRVIITKYNEDTLDIISFSNKIGNSIAKEMKKQKIKIIDLNALDYEIIIRFNRCDLDEVAKIVNAKKQTKTVTGIRNKNNYSFFKRVRKWELNTKK